jgi:hypothetical protein
MSAVSAFLAPPSALHRLAPRKDAHPRRCAAVAPVAGRPSSYPDATGFSEENKSGAGVGDEVVAAPPVQQNMTEAEMAEGNQTPGNMTVDGVIRAGKAAEFKAPNRPMSANAEGSKWVTFCTEDEARTPYYYNKVTGETTWCVLAFFT